MKKQQPFFYFKKLLLWEKWVIGIYLFLTFLLIACYEKLDIATSKNVLTLYIILPQLSFSLIFYKSLRNLSFYLFWFAIGIIQFGIYLFMIGDYYQQMSPGQYYTPVEYRNTIILLLLFQLLRWVSIKIQHKEFVLPSRTGKDLFDNREYTFLDFMILVAYMAGFLGLIACS